MSEVPECESFSMTRVIVFVGDLTEGEEGQGRPCHTCLSVLKR